MPSDVGLHQAAVKLALIPGFEVRCKPIVKAALSRIRHIVGRKLHSDLELLTFTTAPLPPSRNRGKARSSSFTASIALRCVRHLPTCSTCTFQYSQQRDALQHGRRHRLDAPVGDSSPERFCGVSLPQAWKELACKMPRVISSHYEKHSSDRFGREMPCEVLVSHNLLWELSAWGSRWHEPGASLWEDWAQFVVWVWLLGLPLPPAQPSP